MSSSLVLNRSPTPTWPPPRHRQGATEEGNRITLLILTTTVLWKDSWSVPWAANTQEQLYSVRGLSYNDTGVIMVVVTLYYVQIYSDFIFSGLPFLCRNGGHVGAGDLCWGSRCRSLSGLTWWCFMTNCDFMDLENYLSNWQTSVGVYDTIQLGSKTDLSLSVYHQTKFFQNKVPSGPLEGLWLQLSV